MEYWRLITIDTVSKIQKELDSYDRTSLILLLYDNPVIALQRINKNDNALKQWAVEYLQDHSWQEKFIESLAICKLYGVIKKLGFDVTQVKARYSPQNIDTSVYVDPVRKLFYLASEQIRNEDLNTIKTNLRFDIDSEDINHLEIIILKVLCEGKHMEKLLTAISKISSLTTFVFQIRERISDNLLSEFSVNEDASTSNSENSSNACYKGIDSDKILNQDKLDYYPIKNIQRVGLAYIINQTHFINNTANDHELENRDGSDMDETILKQTLEKFNFTVLVSNNLTSRKIRPNIVNVINTKFKSDDSIFVLCILSHGIAGQIFGTDCIPVKITDIQKDINTKCREKLKDIPKVIFLQACQGIAKLVPDAPLAVDYLLHWATSPEYDAFRDRKTGSIFIRVLCIKLEEHGRKKHLVDICTRVNNYVNIKCTSEKVQQLPNYKSTLRKDLYLCPLI